MNGGTFAGCPTGAQYAIQVIDMGADGTYEMSPTKTVYYDTLDREIDADTQSFSGGLSRVTKTYNTQLQLASVTRPYVPGATPATTTYAYDALNRVTRTNYPDSSWDTIQYPATSKSITSGITSSYAGQNIWKTYDGRGNLTQSIQGVTESGKFAYIFSEYLYDGFNNLTRYTDPAGNLTKYGYDLLGRKTGITDPDAGTRTQSYGAFGDLLTVLDGKNNLATMTYDLLSRMTLRCWTNGNPGDAQTCPHPSATEIKEAWSYDPANGVGEIAGETSSSGTGYSAAHTYNGKSPTLGLLGQPATSTITINSTIFSYSYGYDDNNRPFYYFAPSGALPITQHNTYGYVSSLVDGYGGPTVWTANTRDAEGHLTSATFKNGITAIFAFDPKTGRETSFANQAPQGGSTITLQQALYQWDQLGNLLNRNDAINALNETYGYDELDRLTSITLPNNVSESTFSYDVLGNMLTNGGSTYTYPPAGSAQPHGVSSMQTVFGSIGFAYDLDGNVATETGAAVRTLVFTPFNMPQSVNNGGSGGKTITFQYDADHNRVMQSAPEGTTYYLPDGEQTPGAVWHTYFQVDGQRVAEDYGVTGALKHHYFHNDDQNTIGLVTDDTFNVANFPNGAWNVQNEGAAPFGQPRAANGGADWTWGAGDVTRRRWINQEDLADVQLIDLNARLYDPSIGKFMSPDPIISDQDDSQSWNAYAYSHNNPMSGEDPTGLACVGAKECLTVYGQPRNVTEGGANAAHWASVRAGSWRPVQVSPANAFRALSHRAATGGPQSAAARSLAENQGVSYAAAWSAENGVVAKGLQVETDGSIWGLEQQFGRQSINSLGWLQDMVITAGAAGLAEGAAEGVADFSAIGSTGRVGEAALQELGGESQAYFNTNLGGRYIDQLVDGWANEAKVGYQSLTPTNQLQILKDVDLINSGQINGSTWHFFTSPVTGLGGPSAPLGSFLEQNGIGVVVH